MRKLLTTTSIISGLAMPLGATVAYEVMPVVHPALVSTSQISVPLSIDLAYLQSRINNELGMRLYEVAKYTQKCVDETWTKIPKFKGLKLYTQKLILTPAIYCDVWGHVERRGDLTVGGSGNTVQFSLPIHASMSAKAVGIQETAKADATFFMKATPDINSEWQPTLNISSDFQWDRRPEIRLLNMIKVTIGSKVEPKLRAEITKFEASVPAMLQELNLRAEVEKIWSEVQDPIRIAEAPQTWAVFVPAGVGFSGFDIEGQSLDTQVFLEGETRIFVGEKPQVEKVALLPLGDMVAEPGKFSLAVPIAIQEGEVQTLLDPVPSDLLTFKIDEGVTLQGTLMLSELDIEMHGNGDLRLMADVHFDNRSDWLKAIDIFDWFDVEGRVELSVVPALDESTQMIYTQSLRLDSETNSGLADALVDLMDLPLVRDALAEQLKYDFSEALAEGIAEANFAMNQSVDGEVHISGALVNAGVRDLVITDGLLFVVAEANGAISASVGGLSN